jgi:putative glutamine amidotransferase
MRCIFAAVSVLIGIAPDVDESGRTSVEESYLEAVRLGGGEPRVLDAPDALREATFGGLLLCGGAFDIPPDWYGQEPRARLDPPRQARSRLERALLTAAEARGLAVLGICNGAQLMAVHRGGTLVQDLATLWPGALDHERGAERTRAVHRVDLALESRLAARLGVRELGVNSSHHQSVERPGAGVSVVGRAPDGVVEAIEDPEREFWVGVQWHPERMRDAASAALLSVFVQAARRSGCGA